MNRKGELTSTQIVSIILIIAGFIVIALFLPTVVNIFSSGGEVDRELCFQSVLARATARELPAVGGNAADAVPLRCTTEKICISESGRADACDQFLGEENVRAVEISGNVENSARIIERESANAMFFCWQMMGEGKLDIFGKGTLFESAEPKCVICSRVAIADDVSDEVRAEVNVVDYMNNERVPGSSLTYTQFLSDQRTSSFPDSAEFSSGLLTNEYAFIFGQVKSTSFADAINGVGEGALLIGGPTLLTSLGRKAVFSGPGVLLTLVGLTGTSGVAVYESYQSQQVAAAYCGSFQSTADAKQGCSIVTGLKWDATQINSFCADGIEGEL